MDIRGWQEINSLNGAAWSLLWEYVANILYAVVIRRLTKIGLGIFVGLSACLTVSLCLNLDWFGLLAGRDAAAYTVIGGFGLSPDQIFIGLSRLLFPFFGGLLLFRLGKRITFPRHGFLICSLAIAAIMAMPHIGGPKPNILNGLYYLIAIIAIFPTVVAAGAGSPLRGKKRSRYANSSARFPIRCI